MVILQLWATSKFNANDERQENDETKDKLLLVSKINRGIWIYARLNKSRYHFILWQKWLLNLVIIIFSSIRWKWFFDMGSFSTYLWKVILFFTWTKTPLLGRNFSQETLKDVTDFLAQNNNIVNKGNNDLHIWKENFRLLRMASIKKLFWTNILAIRSWKPSINVIFKSLVQWEILIILRYNAAILTHLIQCHVFRGYKNVTLDQNGLTSHFDVI